MCICIDLKIFFCLNYQLDYQRFRQFLELLVDNSDIPEDLCRHLFVSFIKKPALAIPVDTSLSIGVFPLATPAIPPLPTTTTTISSSPLLCSSTIAPPTTFNRTFEIADKLPSLSFLSDRLFRSKRGLTNLTDDTGTGGSNDPKARSGKINDLIPVFFLN